MISRKKNSNKRRMLATVLVLFIALALQIGFWSQTFKMQPKLSILAPIPSDIEAAALSFGDTQLYFRTQTLSFQFMGDTWGRSTPLKDYDYKEVYKWLKFLDKYDPKSNFLPSTAAYYYSKTQRPSDVTYILDYLEERSFADPEYNWWWLSQSIYLANSILGDKERAIRIANVLRQVKADVPIWARQMEAFLQEDLGNNDKAADIMCDAIKNTKNFEKLPKNEIDFFVYFFQERLKTWKGKENELIQYCAQREYLKEQGLTVPEAPTPAGTAPATAVTAPTPAVAEPAKPVPQSNVAQ